MELVPETGFADSTPGGGFSNSENRRFSGIPAYFEHRGMLHYLMILGVSSCLWIWRGILSLKSSEPPESAVRVSSRGFLGDPGVSVGDPGVSQKKAGKLKRITYWFSGVFVSATVRGNILHEWCIACNLLDFLS